MLQPRKPLDLSQANEILSKERKPLDLSSANEILKKKSTNPTQPNTESIGEIGSLDSSESKSVVSKYKEGTLEWNQQKLKQSNPDYVAKFNEVKSVKQITPENKQKALSDLQSEKDNEGFGDYLLAGAKKIGTLAGSLVNEMAIKPVNQAMTMFGKTTREDIDDNKGIIPLLEDTYKDKIPFEKELAKTKKIQLEAKIQAKKSKQPIPTFTQEQTQETAEKLFLKEREESYVNTQVKDYFQDNVTNNEKLGLNVFQISEKKSLNEKDKNLLQEQNVQRGALTTLKTELESIQTDFKNNKGSQESLDVYNSKKEQYSNLLTESIATHQKYVSNREEIGNADENLDIFKRDYGFLNNFIGKVSASTGDIVAGVVDTVNYGLELKKNIVGGQNGIDGYAQNLAKGVAKDIRDDATKTRDGLTKPISVDNVNGFSDFGDYLAHDLIASQLPNFALLLGLPGYGGAVAFGSSALGNKFSEMQGENERGEKQYSTTEMMLNPVGYGVTETASMVVDKMLLAGAGRVIASATAPERQLIAKGMANRFLSNSADVGKQYAKGVVVEGLDEGATKGFQNLIDGKPFFEDIKDPIVAGGIMGAFMSGTPALVAKIIKPFTTDAKIQKTSTEILNLQAELDNPNLDLDTKQIIKTNLDKTKEGLNKLLTKTIGNIESLSAPQFQEIQRIEVALANMKDNARNIEFNDDINEDVKKQILGNLKSEFDAQNQRRLDLLERGANVQLDRLDDKEQIRLKDAAGRELMKEQNPDGTKSITLEDNEISKRAIQIYNKEKAVNAEVQSTVTKPQAEKVDESNNSQISNPSENGDLAEKPIETPGANQIKPQKPSLVEDVVSEVSPVPSVSKLSENQKESIKRLEQEKSEKLFLEPQGLEERELIKTPSYISNRKIEKEYDAKIEAIKNEANPQEEVVSKVVDNDFSKKSIEDLEKRQAEIEGDKVNSEEFNKIDKELEKREWQSVMLSPLSDVKSVLDGLLEKEKNMPNGFGTYIDKKDVRESMGIVSKYQGEVSKSEASNDFKDAFFGNPSSWYADGLKLKESVRVFVEKGGTFKELLQGIQKGFEQDGFSEEDAAGVIKNKLDKISKANEATPPSNTPTNRNVRLGANLVEQNGNAEQQNNPGENVQNANDGGSSEKPVQENKLTKAKRIKSVNNAEYDVDFNDNGSVKEIRSAKDGRVIPKFVERKVKVTKKNPSGKTLNKNPNYSKIEADATGSMTANQINEEEKVKRKIDDEKINDFEPNDEYGAALKYIATGGKVKLDSARTETGERNSKAMKWAAGFNKESDLESIEVVAESLAMSNENLDEYNLRTALIEVFSTFESVKDVRQALLENFTENKAKLDQQELNAFLGLLTEQELALYEYQMVEDEYVENLTEDEIHEYYGQENSRTKSETENGLDARELDKESESDVEIPDGQEKAGEPTQEVTPKKSKIKEVFNQENIKDDLDWLDSLKIDTNNLNSTLPFLPQVFNALIDAVKVARMAGNSLSKAIEIAREELGAKFKDTDVDNAINVFAEKVGVKVDIKPTQKEPKKPIDKNALEKDSFEDMAGKMPSSEIFGKFLSGETTERVNGEAPTTDQSYEKVQLLHAFAHGENIIAKAKEQFGDNYISKILEYVDSYQLDPANVALILNSLENDLRDKKRANSSDITIKKQFDLVQLKRQQYSKSIGQALNMNKLQNMAYYGYDTSETTDLIFSDKEIEQKRLIERALESDANAINNEAEFQENNPINPNLEKLISEGVQSQINEIYKKLPTNRRVKADKAILALEKIQSNLRSKVYDASVGIPIAIIDSGITVIKNAIKAGVNIADAVEIGINYIKEKHGKNWAKENDFRSDIINGFKKQNIETKQEKTKSQELKEIVKNALIDAGFGREINVTKKDENGNKVKEKRNILDWKQLAGEEGSIDNIKKNVEETLKKQGYSKSDIAKIQQDLITEYTNLRASIVEKSLNELKNRNTVRKVNVKATAQRMAELYNLGLFDKNATEYDNLLNSLLGLNDFDSKTYQKLKEQAKALSELYATKLDPLLIQPKIDEIQKQVNTILFQFAYKNGSFRDKAVTITQEFMNISQRMILHSLGQIIQNPFSGIVQRAYTKAGNAFLGSDSKALRNKASVVAKSIFTDITANGALSFGNVDSNLASRGQVEDIINDISKNKNYHRLVSSALGKMHLEAADSYFKYLQTHTYLVNNLITILTSKTNPQGAMTKKEAIRYVSESLTGQSFEDAKVKALNLINDINAKAGKELLTTNDQSVIRLADSLVKASLVTNGKITQEQLTIANEAAYTSAGFDLGHEANNFVSKRLKLYNNNIDAKVKDAIKQKNWSKASHYKIEQILSNNILNAFVGGGSNWIVLSLEKAGLNPVSLISMVRNNQLAKYEKVDLESDAGMKTLKEALKRKTNAQNTNVRVAIGSMVGIASYVAWASLKGKDDDDEEEDYTGDYQISKSKATQFKRWMFQHPEFKKYFNYLAPTAVAITIAGENGELSKELGKILGVRGDIFDDGVKAVKAIGMLHESVDFETGEVLDQEKYSKAKGELGKVVGSKANVPLPWRTVKDFENVYRSLNGLPVFKPDYKAKGFVDGLSKGGFVEWLVNNPDEIKEEE